MTIRLGDYVRDTLSPFEGVVVARAEWLNGCVRVAVQSDALKDGLPLEAAWFDEPQLRPIMGDGSKPASPATRTPTGGPARSVSRRADPGR